MISAETPALFAKACELFILELTLRAWENTEESKRKTLQRSDISAAISKTDMYDFLIDIVPREDNKSPQKIDDRPPSHGIPPSSDFTPYYAFQQPQMMNPQSHFPPGHLPMQV
jgi:nuclear transcription factor Y, gamma